MSFALRHRPLLRRLCWVGAATVLALSAVVAWGALEGERRRYFLLYYVPFFVAFFVWARLRVDAAEEWTRGTLAVDGAVVALAASRMAGPLLPLSGHMLFYSYSALTTRDGRYRLLALALAADATYFKLALWDDASSWGLGIAAGVAMAIARGRWGR
ncbi:MAG TPA: hypothetical protein VFQ45_05255 [Longimicrobium sp.]|nr:hypothetical protein [Longimicrobium sp.]